MDRLKKCFFKGLKAVVPVLLTVIVFYWAFMAIEDLCKKIIFIYIDPSLYFMGLGSITGIIFLILIGIILEFPIIAKIVSRFSRYFLNLPMIKTIYSIFSDIMTFFSKKGLQQGQVVKMKTSMGNLIGIITHDNLSELDQGLGEDCEVAVYIPMSYQIGGFTFLAKKSSLEKIDIPIQKGLSLALTGCMSKKKK